MVASNPNAPAAPAFINPPDLAMSKKELADNRIDGMKAARACPTLPLAAAIRASAALISGRRTVISDGWERANSGLPSIDSEACAILKSGASSPSNTAMAFLEIAFASAMRDKLTLISSP